MRRRRFLAAAGVGTVATLAGCTAVESLRSESEPTHPLAGETTTVRIDNRSETDHDVETNAWRALAFWEANSPEYVGFDVAFEVVQHDDPDVVIEYADSPSGCQNVEGYSERVMGCAPRLQVGSTPPDPIPVYVVAGARPFGEVLITAKHEVGHVLGLGHDDRPREIMSNRPEDRIPLHEVRIGILESVLDAQEHAAEATGQFNSGTGAWQAESYDDAAAMFREARESFSTGRQLVADSREESGVFDGHPRQETIDLETVRAHLDRIGERMGIAVEFADLMRSAALAAADDRQDAANDHVREANDRIESFNGVESPTVRDVAVALGLIRGTDRDETVVDIGREPI